MPWLPEIAERLTRQASLSPTCELGAMILWDSQTLANRGLLVIASLIGIGLLLTSHRPVAAAQRFRQPLAQLPDLKHP